MRCNKFSCQTLKYGANEDSFAGFVLAQGGAVELKFPGKNFFRSIPSNYGPYKHPGAVFADFAAQVGFL